MPYRTDRPKTTTARAKPAIAELPALPDRLMEAGGVDILETIARCQRSNIDCVARHITSGKRRKTSRYSVVRGLSDIGLVEIRNADKVAVASGIEAYRLTDKGWAFVGGKPFWMEAAE